MGMAALLLCGTVNANSWRVCSKPEAGANFLSVADAVASNNVFAGDTLYVEPGHYESGDCFVSKQLVIIGTGYLYDNNNINAIDPNSSVIRFISIDVNGCKISGCVILDGIRINGHVENTVVNRCYINGTLTVGGPANTISQNIIHGMIRLNTGSNYGGPNWNAGNVTIQNNIIKGRIAGSASASSITICNNTVIDSVAQSDYDKIVYAFVNSNIYNNIFINTSSQYTTNTNTTTQVIDTIYDRDYLNRDNVVANNTNFYNNIISAKENDDYLNCVFNVKVEDVLLWNNANTEEEKYKHKPNGPAVGAGVNGTTCGAYGVVNGGQAYQPAGIPKYRPYIYDANIDETPSTNNTINASFKIKVQQ